MWKSYKAHGQLLHMVQNHPDMLEAILAAGYLADMKYDPGLVLPFLADRLHQILIAGKLAQMKDVAIDVIHSMACYGKDASPYASDVVECTKLTACTPRVKDAVIEFLIATAYPDLCIGAFYEVAVQSPDPVISQWGMTLQKDSDGEEDDEENPPRWVVDGERGVEDQSPTEGG